MSQSNGTYIFTIGWTLAATNVAEKQHIERWDSTYSYQRRPITDLKDSIWLDLDSSFSMMGIFSLGKISGCGWVILSYKKVHFTAGPLSASLHYIQYMSEQDNTPPPGTAKKYNNLQSLPNVSRGENQPIENRYRVTSEEFWWASIS